MSQCHQCRYDCKVGYFIRATRTKSYFERTLNATVERAFDELVPLCLLPSPLSPYSCATRMSIAVTSSSNRFTTARTCKRINMPRHYSSYLSRFGATQPVARVDTFDKQLR